MTKRSTPLNILLLGGLLGLAPFTPAQTTEEPFVVGVCAHELHKGDPSGRAYAMMRDAASPPCAPTLTGPTSSAALGN